MDAEVGGRQKGQDDRNQDQELGLKADQRHLQGNHQKHRVEIIEDRKYAGFFIDPGRCESCGGEQCEKNPG